MDLKTRRKSRFRLQAVGILSLIVALISPLPAEQNVTLGWNPNPEPSVAGYRIYSGTASKQYTSIIDAGKRTSGIVPGLVAGNDYFFAVTAYTTNGVESDFSDEISYTPKNLPPKLNQIAPQTARIGVPLIIPSVARDPDSPSQEMRFDLSQDAPEGAAIDPVNGVFQWLPLWTQGGMAYTISIQVTDNGSPPLSDTIRFTTWVAPSPEVHLGAIVLRAGEQGNVPIRLISSLPITNLCFSVEVPPDRMKDLALDAAPENLVHASVTALTSKKSLICMSFLPGPTLVRTQIVGRLKFTAVPGQSTSLIPLRVAEVQATDANGHELSSPPSPEAGRVVIVGKGLMLEAVLASSGTRSLTVYGEPPTRATLEMASNPAFPFQWTKVGDLEITNLVQTIISLPESPFQVFRIEQVPPAR